LRFLSRTFFGAVGGGVIKTGLEGEEVPDYMYDYIPIIGTMASIAAVN